MATVGDEAVNLLSLDGGGVRGVSSLVILHEIMTKIKDTYGLDEIPKPCEFFHMIAGTSTGGLMAIMLGRLRMSTEEALQEYDNCSAKIFASKNKKTWSISERFQATALQEAVEGIVKQRGRGERMRDPENPPKGKVVVCVMPSNCIGKPRLVRSFSGDPGDDDQWDKDIAIWEAARATTAASSFFKPQKLGSGATAQTYIDAAIGVNNPVVSLLDEAVKEFGSGRRLGCVVSIGTGTRDIQLGRALSGIRNFVQGPRFYIHLIKTLKSTATDAEDAHRQLQSRLLPFPGSYYRFNVPEAAEAVGLHHYKKMPVLKSLTAEYLGREEIATQVRKIAEGLQTDVFDHGLTLGLIFGLDKEQVVLSNTNAQRMNMSSSFFTGRREILQKLDSLFSPRNTGGKPRRECLLHGMGGVGKTEIALKAGEVFEERFKYIFFVDGTMPATISQSYAQICKQYNLGNGTTEAMRNHAMQWIEGLTEEWLMVFDDCNLSDRRGHLPGRGKGNVIYTSRTTTLLHGLPADCVLEVTPFGVPDAVELLLKASGSQATPDNPDADLAQKIVAELGCLPLAIDQAAASIRDRLSLGSYLDDLRTRKVSISHDPRFQGKIVENPIVYAALDVSYASIKARKQRGGRQFLGRSADIALKLLGLLCFYHYRAFPISAFGRAAKERHKRKAHLAYPLATIMECPDSDFDQMLDLGPDGSWNMNYVAVGLKVLETFSLIKRDPDQFTVSMHVLVHSWARHRMEKEQYLRYCLLANIVLSESIVPSWKWVDKAFARSLGPHASVCFVRRSKDLHHGEYEAQLKLKRGWQCELNKDFYDAEKLFLECLRFWKVEHGNNSWSVINTLQRLGGLYHEMGRLGDAEVTYLEVVERLRRRIRDHEATTSEEEPGLGTAPPSHSSTDRSKHIPKTPVGKPTQSRRFTQSTFKRFLEGRRNDGSEGEPVAVAAGPSTSSKATMTVKTEAAEPVEELDALWCHYYLVHADLARVYMDQDRFGMGQRMLLRAAEYLEDLLPEDSPELMRVQNEAKAVTEPGNLEFWNTRVKQFTEIASGDESELWDSETGWQLIVTYADCQLENRMYEMAYQQYRGAYELFERIYGPYDKRILDILRRMVICKVEGDDCDRAVEIAIDCLHRARRGSAMDLANGPAMDRAINTAWQHSKAHLERIRPVFGEHHLLVRRFARFVGDGPARTLEEHLERSLACFGPHSTVTKDCQAFIEGRRAALAEAAEHDGEASSAGPLRGRPPVIGLCICGEAAHAEGSRWNESFQENEADESGGEDVGVGLEAPRPLEEDFTKTTTGTVLDGMKRVEDRWRNRPYYFCGLY
ncbi:hypothetical protein C8A00DRAFT_17376 [Chaetomidium leptoderma]|uniref:PNPLA domain-containing protein n=1 Tax=Chaetomidium leptoderma TaxID=669021 RepID=A0AAN6ZTD1_9PEZI|nr:hypothetical protein C8A00DRAFT_17376 [Chaetomidium leptoderma]